MDWINIKESLPEEKQNNYYDFEYVLCATTFGDVRPYKYGTPSGWKNAHFWNGPEIMDAYVTHWMPLPEMPDDKKTDHIDSEKLLVGKTTEELLEELKQAVSSYNSAFDEWKESVGRTLDEIQDYIEVLRKKI